MRNRLDSIPGPDQPHLEQWLDIQMMVSGPNWEHREAESANLLKMAGFEHIKTYQNEGVPMTVVETRPIKSGRRLFYPLSSVCDSADFSSICAQKQEVK